MKLEKKIVLAAWVMRSTYRTKIITVLYNHNTTPSIIAKESMIDKHHVSNVLHDLKEKTLVKCLNESEKKGRVYILTNLGKDIYKIIKEMQMEI